ncbi:MAG: DUF2339 domain-containing protein [Gemmatimonadetes bacterium]|nr:DUF2339 domain-containing protein [Gemmatimonadota bacterium]
MDRGSSRTLEERVERLERMVMEIHTSLGLSPGGAAGVQPPPPPDPPPAPASAPSLRREDRWAHWGEQWLGRVGLGLLFLGLVYLFNYSIEQGWLTPVVRVAIGLAIAATLLLLGLRFEPRRRSFGQILLAGALAVFYVTGFAAFQLYQLVSYGAAFVYMAAVMALALALARRQDHPSLASLGALGGFATPLLLHRATPAVLELSVYSALVVAWTAVLYWLRGWPSLLWTYAVGSIAALSVAVQYAAGGERWMVQGALALTWVAGALLPFIRGIVRPQTALALRRGWGSIPAVVQLRVLGVGGTTAALYLTGRAWALPDDEIGALFLAAAAVYAFVAGVGSRRPNPVTGAGWPVAGALCATGSFMVLDHEAARVLLLGAEAMLFVCAGRLAGFAGLGGVGGTVFLFLAAGIAADSWEAPAAAMDSLAWAQLAALVWALVAARFVPQRRVARAYGLAAHALFLVWLAKELGSGANGTSMVTLAWGSYGALLLLLALLWRDRRSARTHGLQLVALSAIALAILKLMLVDLERVPVVWRIGLFMGFGAALLALSSLVKPQADARRSDL